MDNFTNIYMLGIKGAGMASLAAILKKMGKHVWGADVQTREPADALLEKVGIEVKPFGIENITSEIDLIITTGAHGGLKNPEVLAAKEKRIPVMTHAEGLGKLMDDFKTRIAVCGTHGKTTVSSLLAYLLVKMDAPCGYQVGAPSFSGLPGGDYTGNEYFVVESDEYAASPGTDNTPRFMFQNPTHILCTNIEHDHVDIYKSIDDTKVAFRSFFEKLPEDGALIYCADEQALSEVAQSITDVRIYGYSTSSGHFAHISDIHVDNGMTVFTLTLDGQNTGVWISHLSGEHNVKNITGAIIFLYLKGFKLEDIKKHVATFTGSKRRFEQVYESDDYTLIDDYAHHPSEIRETLRGTRLTYPNRRIIVLFQPHTYSRTEAFKEDFAEALQIADKAFILDVYASARETQTADSVGSQDIVDYAQNKGYEHVEYLDEEKVSYILRQELHHGDVILTMGASNIFRLHNAIIEVITSKKTE